MSNFAAVIKSLIGQVFVTSVDGVRRQVFEGDRIFAGEQVTTADGGSVTLEMANGETVKLGANASWQAGNPDAQEVADSASQAPVSEFEQALAAGMDPTVDLDPTAAGPGAGGGGGSAGGGHSAVMLSETAQRVDPTIGFQTTGLGTPGFNLIEDNNPAIFATADAADTGTTTPDTTAPVVTIGINPITGDDILNSAELGAATVTITGTVGGEAKVGDAITLNLGGNVYNGTVIALGNGALGFSIPVSSADLGSFNSISATVSSSDAAGNVGTATASRPYTVDTTAPVITVDAPAITNDTTPTIVGTTDAPVGSTVTLTITQGTTVLTTTATVVAGGTYSADVPAGLVEGPYSVDAKVTDAAGNIGSATDTGAIDTTAPVPTISLDANITPDDVINSTEATQQIPVTGTVGGDAKVGDTVTLTVNGKNFTGQVQADKTFSINVPGADLVADAGKTINASISTTDAAGNLGSAATSEGYSVDVTAPVPTISLDANITADDVINSTEATQQIPVTGTVGGDAKVGDTVTLTVNGKTFTGQVQADKTFSINVPGADLVADAGKTINASISTTDAAGNVGSAATSEGYSVDVTAPAPTITLDANITADDVINSTEATQQIPVTGTVGGDAKVGDTVTLTVNGKDFTGSVATNPNGTLGFSINVPGADLVADAGKTINASISTTDAAGNIGTATDSEGYRVDVTAPAITVDAPAITNDTTPTIVGTTDAPAGSTVTLTVTQGSTVITVTTPVLANGTYSVELNQPLAEGPYSVDAKVTDAAGNTGSATDTGAIDTTAPVITVDAPAITNDTTPTIVGTTDAPAGSTVTLTVTQGSTVITVTTPVLANGTYSVELNQPLAEGPYSVDAKVTDAAGNTGSATDTGAIDTTAPVITVDAPAITNDTTPTIVGTTDAPVGSTVTLTVTQGSTVITVTTPVLANGTYSVELNQPLAEGPYSVDAKATDAAGNTGSATDTGAIDTTAPLITVDAPAVTNDTTPTIVGTTDAPVGSIVTLTVTQGSTVITVTTPVLANGTYSVELNQPLAEGPYSVDAKVTDAAGNTGSATDTGAIDTTAPVITVDAPAITNDTTPTIVGTTDAPVGNTVTLTITQGTTVLTTTATVVAGGTYSADVPAGLVEGPYSVDAKVTDAAGNTGSATDTGAIDTTAPVITVDAPAITNDTTPSIVGTTDAPIGSVVTLTITQGTTVLTTTATVVAGGTYSADVPAGLVEGPYSVDAKVTDAAGNTGSATDTGAIDTTAPVITVDAPAITNDTTPTIVGTTDAPVGSTVILTITQGTTVLTTTATVVAGGTYSADVPAGLVEGPYSVDAKVTDAAGNIGSATDTGAINTTAPVITVDAPAITNDTTPTIVGTTDAPAGSIVTLTVTQGSTVISVTTPVLANGTYSVELNQPLAEGPYSVDAKVTDPAGNTGSATDTGAIDTTAPVITVDAPAVTNDTTPTIVGTTDAPVGSTVTLTITQGTTVLTTTATVVAGGTYSADVPAGLVEGPYSVDAKVTDAAGNTGSATDTGAIDTTAPVITVDAPAVTNDTTPTIVGTTDAPVGSIVTLTITQGTTVLTTTAIVVAGGTYSADVPAGLVEGPYSVDAKVTDAAGNTGSATDTGAIDTTAPVITVDAPTITNDTTPTIVGTTDAPVGSIVTLTITQGTTVLTTTATVVAGGTYSADVPAGLVEGPYSVDAKVTDAAGNTGSATDIGAIDTTAPVPTISLDANITADDVINSTEATQQIPVTGTVGGDAKVGDTVTLNVNGKTFTGQVQADKTFSINVPGADLVADASKTINASISTTDAAGNIGTATDSEGYSVDVTAPVPTISLDANITADDVINSTEATEQIPVTGTVGGDAKVGDTVTLSVNGKTFTGQVQADKTFSINVPGADLVADAGKTINASISTTDAAGNIGTATDSEGYSVNTTLPVPTITLDTNITADDVINSTEATQQIPVTGTVGGDAKVGDTVTLTVNGKQFTGQVQADKTFSINVPGADLIADAGKTINASISTTDAAGNIGTATDSEGYSVDVTPPSAAIDIVKISEDTGTPGDFVTRDNTLTVSGTVGPLASGEKAQISVDGGNTWTDLNVNNGTWDYTDGRTLSLGDHTYQVRVVDAAGNLGSTDTQKVTIIANQNPVAVNDPGNAAGLTGQYYAYHEGTNLDGPNLSSLAQVRAFIDANSPDASFVAKNINYSLGGGDLGGNNNLQTFLGSDAASLNVDPENSSDAIIKLSGTLQLQAGSYQFQVRADDGYSISIDGVIVSRFDGNQSPSTNSGSFTISEPGAHTIEIIYWDQGGQAALQPTLSFAGGAYQPLSNFSPTQANPALVTGHDNALTISQATLLANDSDADGDTLRIVGVDNPKHGTVTLNDNGTITFTPASNYYGPASFSYTVSDGNGGTSTATVTVNVTGDAAPSIGAVSNAVDSSGNQVDEGDNAVFTVNLSNASITSTTFSLSLNAGTAKAGSDYNGTLTNQSFSNGVTYNTANGTVTVPAGVSSFTVTVPTINDTISESTETFSLTVGGKSGTATIIDNDGVPTVSAVSSAVDSTGGQVDEGDNAVFTVNLTNAGSTPTTFSLSLNAGTATAGSDYNGTLTSQSFSNGVTYNAANGTVTVPAGVTSFTVTVPTINDTVAEPTETFSLTVGGKTGTATIIDNDPVPTVSTVSSAVDSSGGQVDEGDNAVFTVNLTNASSTATTFSLALNAGTATAGSDYNGTLTNQSFSNGVTYNAATGQVTVPAGVTSFTVTVPTVDDTVFEQAENFTLTVGGKTGTATIIDNDAAPTVGSVSSAVDSSGGQVDEGDNAVFTVNLTNASSTATTFSLALNAGTATAGSDYNGTLTNQSFSNGVTYNAANGTVTVPAGVTSFTVTVPTVDDTVFEPAENFTLTVGGKTGTATIVDNDAAPTIGTVSSAVDSSGGQVDEGDNAVFTVNLTNASSTPTTFSLALNAGTATAGSDYNGTLTNQSFSNGVTYNAANGTVTVPAGVTTFTVTVPTVDDTVSEPTENFTLTVGGKTGTATIVDNDAAPTIGTVSAAVDSSGGQVDEGDNAVFTVNLTNASSTPTTFSLVLNAGTATAGSDYNGTLTNQSFSNGVTYNAANGTVTVPAGVTSFTVTVPTINDTVYEQTETFTLNVGGKVGTATIIDNDPVPTVSTVSSAVDSNGGQIDEGDNAVFTVNLTNTSSTPTTFSLALNAGTATAGSDYNGTLTNQSFSNGVTYNAATGQVTVPAGVTSFTVTVPTIDDTVSEPTETFSLTVGGKTGTATIIDNDPVPTVSTVSSAVDNSGGQVDEGDNAVFTVNLTNASSTPTTFSLALNAGTATAGSDYNGTLTNQSFSNGVTYNAANGTVTVPAGVTSFTVTVPTIDDSVFEPAENFTLTVGGKTGTATIVDNDAAPTVGSVSSAVDSNGGQVDEGDNAVFTVNLTNASSTPTTFSLTLNAGTATAGSDYNGTLTNQSFSNGVTYNAANGTVTVPAGVTSFTVTVPTVDDTVSEPTETFSLTVGGKTGTATIIDNDAAPTIGTVSAAVDSSGGQVDEGDNAVFTVNLTNASSTATTFSLALNAGTAAAGSDYNGTLTNQSFSNGVTYNAANGTVTVPAGVTSFTVTVPTVDDTVFEPAETFSLTVGGKTGTATIVDNDAAPTIGTVSAAVDSSGGQVDEGDNAVFTVNLTNASSTATTFSLALNAGTATAGSDYNGTLTNQSFSNGVTYNAANGTVTVPAGVTSFTVTVPTIDDTVFEPTENFTLTVGGKTGTATIIDNDAAPTVGSVSSAVDSNGGQVDEGDNAVFTVNLTNASSTATTFSLSLNTGTATAGSDYNGTLTNQSFSNGVTYNAANGTVTVPAGVTSFTVTVPTINDTVYEQTESFTLNVGGKVGTATIIDNDPVPTVSTVSSAVDSSGGQVDEGDNAVFTVNLTNASSTATTFSLALNAGTAIAGSDYNGTLTNQSFSNGVTYNAATGQVTVPAGVTSFTVTVPTVDDTVFEQAENFTLTVGGKTGTATIIDNDAAPTVGSVSSAVDSAGGQVDEGDNAVFTVNLTNASSTPTTFSLALNAGTAIAGSDYNGTLTNQSFSNGVTYNSANGTVTVPAGVTSFTVTVPTINDTVYEQTETFTLNVGGKVGTATIIDNDLVPTVKTIDVGQPGTADDNVIEGNNLVFNVTLSNASSTPTVLSFNATGTATANVDYKLNAQSFSNGVTYDANTGKITVPAGVTSFSVTVQTLADNVVGEPLETVKLDIGGQSATGGIIDGTPDAKDDSYTKVTGLKAEYFGYKEGTGAGNDGANLTNLSQVRQFIDSHKAAATFNATTLDYGNLSNATGLGTGTNLQTFLGVNTTTGNGAKANSLSTDPGDTSDAIIKMSGYINLAAGTYQFRVTADDGYSIRINGQVVAEFNNIQSSATATGKTFTIGAANAGPQQIEIIYWDQGGDARLKVEVGQGGNFKVVDSDMLYHVPTTSTLTMDAGDSLTIASSTLLSNDTDPNNDSLSITSVQNATNGTVTLNNGNVVFTPKSGFYGDASFQYTISDGKGGSDTATVTLKVNQAANVIHVAGDGTNDNGNNTINGGAGSDVLLGDAGGTLTTLQPATNYNIALLVDTSGSMQGDRMSLTKTALSNFVKTLAGHDGVVNVTLVGFAEKVTLTAKVEDLQSGTSLDALLANIQKLTASGGTNYEAAFKEASAWFDAQSTAGHTKAAGYENLTFFLSDGDPTLYYNGNTTQTSGPGSSTNDQVLLGSLDTFNVLAGKSAVQAIGIGSGVSQKNLSLFDNTTDTPAFSYLANGFGATLANFNNDTTGWNNLGNWDIAGTGFFSGSAGRSSDALMIRDTAGGSPVTATTPSLTIADGTFSSLRFAYGTADTTASDVLSWKVQQLVKGAWVDVQTGGGTTGGNWTTAETSVLGAGTYRMTFSVDDKSALSANATMWIDDITRVDYTKVPVGKVEIVNSADELSVALHGGANANVPVSVGNDTIFGGDGNDIIFGDVINTDALPWGVNGNPAKPADMYNGSGVKALETFLELKNGVAPTNADLYDYIRANHDTFNVAGDTRGGADKLYGGNGNDILYGQGGNDLLVGGAGDDILFGGAGADTFAWQKGDFGKDVIKDFNVAEGDTIDLSSLLQDHSNNLDSYLKLVTDNGSSTLLISTKGEFNNADTTTQQVAAKADVQIDLGQASLPSYDINTLIANHTIKVDP
ncbi:Ig-like domain-containing protein [Pseudomonas fulva]|uniref:Type 1 secretion target domain protein n=1 Tax=Pseudomonas fulva (strain 12-X) TaxID=743720 RepID=F6AAV6_PSEF1|nr:Ig-like domain-containing protein [Pseudomonas fulva]AEF23225.1 type 1 secretion target domain protein [Pseudomonas fulva 12-X]